MSSNINDMFEIKIFLFIENLAWILYSREGFAEHRGKKSGGQGALGVQFPMVHLTLSRESSE